MVASARQEKRHGGHQKHTRHFMNVYRPYLPMLVVGAIIVSFLSFGSGGKSDVLSYSTNITPGGLLSLTNVARNDNNEPTFKVNARLARAAQDKANDMVTRDYWSHATPSGQTPWTFINRTGYDYEKAGENLAYGFSTNSQTIYAWMNSPAHRENILDESFNEIGFGIANSKNYVGNGPETVVVAMYGQSVGSKSGQTKGENSPAFNSSGSFSDEPGTKHVAKIALFAKGSAPWLSSAIGVLVGLSLAVLFIRHGLALKRVVKNGELYIAGHPAVDISIVLVVILGIILTRSAGLIK